MPLPSKLIAIIGSTSVPTGLTFQLDKPWRCCRLCGAVYQTDEDRAITSASPPEVYKPAYQRRLNWALNHSLLHTSTEHALFELSGMWCTDIAAHKLASYGIISMQDGSDQDDIFHALRESKSIPFNDSEG